jgi:hypothetical protein
MMPKRNDLAPRPRTLAALALSLLLLAGTAMAAKASDAKSRTKAELEQRVVDMAHKFQNDPQFNKGRTPAQIRDGVEFVTGNVLFLLGHEVAHALISVFKIPVIGREEDAADALATIAALKMGGSFAERVVINAARGWFLSDQRDAKSGTPSGLYDEHGLDSQRAYYLVCLLVGGAPEKFAALADEVKLPKERQKTCHFDYSNAEWSWGEVLKPHKRKPGGPKTRIAVTYAPTEQFRLLSELGQRLRILESVAEWLSEDFAWKVPISLEMHECGKPGSRYFPTTKKVVVCYEIVREFVQLHRDYGEMALVPGAIEVTQNGRVIPARKQPSATVESGQKALRPDQ